MEIVADLHTHTNISEHAFSTLIENCSYANSCGLKAVGITNHGPALEDGASFWHFRSLAKRSGQVIEGVHMISGAEVNIMPGGNVDLDDEFMKGLDLVIASFHQEIYYPDSFNHVTNMLENVLKNKYVNVLGHLGNEIFKFDYERIIKKCNKYNKIVEINNHSFRQRPGSDVNCLEIVKLCKDYSVEVIVNSDAHIATDVGSFDDSLKLLEKANFPHELVVNSSMKNLKSYLERINNKVYFEG